MKTPEQIQAAVDAVRKTCAEHGIVLIGTCWTEGIYGEILVAEATDEAIAWVEPRGRLTNRAEFNEPAGEWSVLGIGDLP